MILFKLFFISLSLFASKKDNYVHTLTKTCTESLKNRMAFDKSQKVCLCLKNEMKKLTLPELKHLVLADAGKNNESSLPVSEGHLLDNYKVEVSYKCLGKKPKQAKK